MPTVRVSSSDGEEILVPPLQEPSMIGRLRSSGGADAAVLATIDLAETPVPDDSGSDSCLSETEVKKAITKHVDPYVPPVSGFAVCRTKAKLRRLHFVGHCGKVPGVHYQDYVHFGLRGHGPELERVRLAVHPLLRPRRDNRPGRRSQSLGVLGDKLRCFVRARGGGGRRQGRLCPLVEPSRV